jgi:glycosyltransferase involved in cell wall biosynthesis
MIEQPILAIITPCYNEEEIINITYQELSRILKGMIDVGKISPNSYICFIDDGSKDKTWELIQNICQNNDAKGIKLSRNGKVL